MVMQVMQIICFGIAICLKILCVKTFLMPSNFPEDPGRAEAMQDYDESGEQYETTFDVIGLGNQQFKRMAQGNEPQKTNDNGKQCLVVVVSNSQNAALQSILRRYRYDANGALIPSSVKYFIKTQQEFGSPPRLVPLTGSALTHLGGYVKYYKEVPPISPTL